MENKKSMPTQIVVKNEKGIFEMTKIIKQLSKCLFDEIEKDIVVSLTLFGSYTKGEATSESDIDLCLIYKSNLISEMKINLIIDSICNELLGEYGVTINILCFSEDYYQKNHSTSPLFINISKEGVLCEL